MDPLTQDVIFYKIALTGAMLVIASNSGYYRAVRILAVVAAILLVGSVVLPLASPQL